MKLKIGGYTDNTGAAAANKTLSKKRADAVVAALVAAGGDKARLAAEGYGQEHPVCPANDTEECKAQNRRIDVNVARAEDRRGVRHQRSRQRPRAARSRARAAAARRSRCTGTRRTASGCSRAMPTCAPRRSSPELFSSQAKGPWHLFEVALLDAGARRARAPPPARHRVEGVHAAHGAAAARDRARDDPRVHRRGRAARALRVRERARVAGAAAADRRHAGPARGALRAVPALERRHRFVRPRAARLARVRRRPGAARGAAARGGRAAARASRATT